MCKIEKIRYTCGHKIKHAWSSCRFQIKSGQAPACRKKTSIRSRASTKCGSCLRAEAEQQIRRDLNLNETDEPEGDQKEIYDALMAEVNTRFPGSNWLAPDEPNYRRKPGQKRPKEPRLTSLLRYEVKVEDVCEPKVWESKVVKVLKDDDGAVYETVAVGWDGDWTDGTRSLADEISEDYGEVSEEESDLDYEEEDEEELGEQEEEEDMEGETMQGDFTNGWESSTTGDFQPVQDSGISTLEGEGNDAFSSAEDQPATDQAKGCSDTLDASNGPSPPASDISPDVSNGQSQPASDISLEEICPQPATNDPVSSQKEQTSATQQASSTPATSGNSTMCYWFRLRKSGDQGQVELSPWELVYVA